jgi:oxygen-independent coproporphyrinogen-3 oxidase
MTATAHAETDRMTLFDAPAQVNASFGVYIHIPFCSHICPYCDFNTYAGQSARIPAYLEAVKREIEIWSPLFPDRVAESVFIGGGTPSLLTANQIADLIDTCAKSFALTSDAEITIESNPNDLSERYCAGLLGGGVNRISIGAQSLDRRGLRVLGRMHEAETVSNAVAAARAAGFSNLSLDFIYGWPGQIIDRWRHDLDQVLAGEIGGSPPDHLSLYGLIVEPGTPMADAIQRGILTPVDDDVSADFFELAISMLVAAGWLHYEIANWASTPRTASRHNAIYWRNGDYAGIGAGAHGHAQGTRTMNQPSPRRYIDMLQARRSPVTNVEQIDPKTEMAETMLLGLRLVHDGVSQEAFLARHGRTIAEQVDPQIARLHALGLVEVDERRIRLTNRGVLLANSVCAEFV